MQKTKILVSVIGATLLLSGCGSPALPSEANVDVPFTTQAPAGDWSEPWQNACEETSIYMVASFYAEDDIKRDEAILRIREIFKTKHEEFKVSKDESLATIAELIQKLDLPWSARLVYDPTIDDLKAELAAGRPIIVSVYAPALEKSFYVVNDIQYHVLVLVGYDDADGTFIVNDPGTQFGEGLRFPYATFMDAIHDLNPEDYEAGKKAVLFSEVNKTWEDWLGTATKE